MISLILFYGFIFWGTGAYVCSVMWDTSTEHSYGIALLYGRALSVIAGVVFFLAPFSLVLDVEPDDQQTLEYTTSISEEDILEFLEFLEFLELKNSLQDNSEEDK